MKTFKTFNILEQLNAKEIIPILVPYEDMLVQPLIETRGDSSKSVRELVTKVRKLEKERKC